MTKRFGVCGVLKYADDPRAYHVSSALVEASLRNAEAHDLIPHAARMRVVLAQRTGDRTQLKRARSILEQLGDRQFLRRLEGVAVSLE